MQVKAPFASNIFSATTSRIVAGLILVALVFALQSDSVCSLLVPYFSNAIEIENSAFLHSARTQSLDDLLLLGEIMAVLEVVQSTEIGFSFVGTANVQVGQALSGLNMVLEKAVLAALVGGTVYEGLIVLTTLATRISPILFDLALLTAAARLLIQSLGATNPVVIASKLALRGLVLLLLASYVLIPYSVNLTGWLAHAVPSEMALQHTDTLKSFHAHVTPPKEQVRTFSGWTKEHVVRGYYLKFAEGLPHTFEFVARHALMTILHTLFVGVVLPLAIFWIFWQAARRYPALAAIRPKQTLDTLQH